MLLETIRVSNVIVSLFLISNVKAQGLQIGDRISNFEIKSILNYESDNARLTDFIKGKALLIDFWFTACSSCIESFPKLLSIQEEFKDDLNILLVTYESKEKALKTFNNIKRISHVKLPSVVADTLLHLIFPHLSAPHGIWVDKNGKVKAVTDHRPINRENIHSLIKGEELNLPIKKDNFDFSFEQPFINTLDKSKTLEYSYFSTFQPGIPSSDGFYVDPVSGFLKVKGTNGHLQSLYILAYNQWGKGFNYNRMIMDSSVSNRFKESEDNQNVFCYENWWRDTSKAKACIEMQKDLDRYFNLKSYTEKRRMPCIILREIGTQKRYMIVNLSEREDAYKQKDTFYLKNVYLQYPIANIFNYGRYAWAPFQFYNETGYHGKVNIRLPSKFENIDQVNRYLKEFDLGVTIEDRWQEVIVIKEATIK
jgi:thiol-disulfide isomerase/thioredoxin